VTQWLLKDSVQLGVGSGERKRVENKPNGLNMLLVSNIPQDWEKQTQTLYVSCYQQLRAKKGPFLAKFV
jgi:hypothetical protein